MNKKAGEGSLFGALMQNQKLNNTSDKKFEKYPQF